MEDGVDDVEDDRKIRLENSLSFNEVSHLIFFPILHIDEILQIILHLILQPHISRYLRWRINEYEEAHRTIKFLEKNGVECTKTLYTYVG